MTAAVVLALAGVPAAIGVTSLIEQQAERVNQDALKNAGTSHRALESDPLPLERRLQNYTNETH
jgi:hypothetical protein